MRSFWSDPYLWVHLAGVAALPIFLEICFLSLAVGDPFLPVGLELLFVAAVGIAPVLWMQWQRPFYIFSLMVIALKPGQLTEEQRRILRLFKTQENRVLAVLVPVFLTVVLWQLYRFAPLALDVAPFPLAGRGVGLLVAAIAFLASNLFLQVPVSVMRVLLASETEFANLEPYPLEQIAKDFTLLGLRVKRILPPFIASPPALVIPIQPSVLSVESMMPAQPPPAAEIAESELDLLPNPWEESEAPVSNSPAPELPIPELPIPESPVPESPVPESSVEPEFAINSETHLSSEPSSLNSEPSTTPSQTDFEESEPTPMSQDLG